jgi:hypothetical protein
VRVHVQEGHRASCSREYNGDEVPLYPGTPSPGSNDRSFTFTNTRGVNMNNAPEGVLARSFQGARERVSQTPPYLPMTTILVGALAQEASAEVRK